MPLAVGITPAETTDCLTALFNLVKRVLPDYCFSGRGTFQGPMMIMTNDSVTEQAALKNVWPE